jgi:hypothetical protein
MSEASTEPTGEKFAPPYISFAQLENVLDRMRNEGMPARIDRSYLGSWSGSSQAQFLKATASLGLRDEHGRPTEILKRLVAEPDARPAIIGELLREKYPEALALGQDATQAQLDEVFRNYDGISGGTTRKAITFYLHAAKFAGIPVSPFFKAARPTSTGGTRSARSRSPRRTGGQDNGTPPSAPAPPAPVSGLHPAVLTLVQALPAHTDGASGKPVFSEADREAWFDYARATFNLIYATEGSR